MSVSYIMLKALFLLFFTVSILHLSFGQTPGPFTSLDTNPLLSKLRNESKDTNQVRLLLSLSDHYFYRIERKGTELDSAAYYSVAAQKLSAFLSFGSGLAMAEYQLAAILPFKNLRNQGRNSAVKALNYFLNQKEYIMAGESYNRLAGYYALSEKEIQHRIALLNKARATFHKGGNNLKEGHSLKDLGDLYLIQGDYLQALSMLKQALRKYQVARHPQLMGVYDLLGMVYVELGSPSEGLKYGLLAVKNAHDLKDTSLQVCTFYNRLGITNFTMGRYEKAYDYFDLAFPIAIKFKDIESIHIVASNISATLGRLQKPQEAIDFLNKVVNRYPLQNEIRRVRFNEILIANFRELKQFHKADKYASELVDLTYSPSLEDKERSQIYEVLTQLHYDKGEYSESQKYVDLNLKLARENAYINYFWQSKLDSVRKDYFSAMKHFQKYVISKDSVFDKVKSKQVKQLEIIYGMEKKNDNIQLLKKQSLLQSGMLRQASLIKNVSFAGIGLLLIIVSLLAAGYVLIRKNSRIMALRQSEIDQKNHSLQRLVSEKEWLVKEIHHRVKNNLSMIVGFLGSQSNYLNGSEARNAIVESQHRIQAMSMIHQKLYQTENLSSLNISAYIHELVLYLEDSFNSNKSITFELKIEPLLINISHLIPLGLILNEAITNSIKYAFPGVKQGKISIILIQQEPGIFILTVADNGIGIENEDLGLNKINSFGLTLIRGLSDDIGGELEIHNDHGTTIQIKFLYHEKEHSEHLMHVSQ